MPAGRGTHAAQGAAMQGHTAGEEGRVECVRDRFIRSVYRWPSCRSEWLQPSTCAKRMQSS